MNLNKNITIFTDASFCDKTKVAGWGAWAKRDGWERGIFHGGPIRDSYITSSGKAELLAILYALRYYNNIDAFVDMETIMIQSDSVDAIRSVLSYVNDSVYRASNITSDVKNIQIGTLIGGKQTEDIMEEITDISRDKILMLRHVKGHKASSKRGRVNDICDEIAKKHMRSIRGK